MSSWLSKRGRRHLQELYGGYVEACKDSTGAKACAITVDCRFAPHPETGSNTPQGGETIILRLGYPTLSGTNVGALSWPLYEAATKFLKYRCRGFRLKSHIRVDMRLAASVGPHAMWVCLYMPEPGQTTPSWYVNWAAGSSSATNNYNTNLLRMQHDPRCLAYRFVQIPMFTTGGTPVFFTLDSGFISLQRSQKLIDDAYEEDTTQDGSIASSATAGSFIFTGPTNSFFASGGPNMYILTLSADEASQDSGTVNFVSPEVILHHQADLTKYFVFHDPIKDRQVLPVGTALAS